MSSSRLSARSTERRIGALGIVLGHRHLAIFDGVPVVFANILAVLTGYRRQREAAGEVR
jgi:hypothetical protein